MTVCSVARYGITRSQVADVEVMPWIRTIAGPLPAQRYATRCPWRTVSLSSKASSGTRRADWVLEGDKGWSVRPTSPRGGSHMFAQPREVRALGDLYANAWQVAYVTRDLDDGMALLREYFGIESTEVP